MLISPLIAPLEKFTTTLEDIFEAEDALSPEAEAHSMPREFFSWLSPRGCTPFLSSDLIRRLSKLIGNVKRPVSSRARTSADSPRKLGRMKDVDPTSLSRLLKILERSVSAAKDLDPLQTESSMPREKTASPQKAKSKSHHKGVTGGDGDSDKEDGDEDGDERVGEQEVTEVELAKLASALEIARDGILAADCCIALLGSDRLPKQVSDSYICISSAHVIYM